MCKIGRAQAQKAPGWVTHLFGDMQSTNMHYIYTNQIEAQAPWTRSLWPYMQAPIQLM